MIWISTLSSPALYAPGGDAARPGQRKDPAEYCTNTKYPLAQGESPCRDRLVLDLSCLQFAGPAQSDRLLREPLPDLAAIWASGKARPGRGRGPMAGGHDSAAGE